MKSWTYLSRAATDISCAVSPTKAIQVGQMLNWELANKISPWKSCSCQLVKDYQRWRHDHNITQNIIFQTQGRFSLSREYGLNDGAKLKLCLFAHRQPVKGGKRWVWIGFGKRENSSVKTISKDFLPVDSFGHYSELVIFYFTTKRLSVDILNIDLFHLAPDNGV